MAEVRDSMIILAGGSSRRMGKDKATLLWAGQTFLDIQLQKAAALGIEDILVSGYHGARQDLHIIADRIPNRGPLGGLEASLRAARNARCLVLSVDAPLVPVSELQQLLSHSRSTPSQITILKCGGQEYPLIGVYDCSLADAMQKALSEGRGSVFAFLNAVGYAVYESPAPARLFSNINTPEDYRAALHMK